MTKKKQERGHRQDALIDDIYKAIGRHRVDIGEGLTFVEVVGCLETVKRDIYKESDNV